MVDRDPASKAYYAPVDLNDPHLLAQDGLAPVRVEPAVPPADGVRGGHAHHPHLRAGPRPAGPLVAASGGASDDTGGAWKDEEYVQRLRIYPHALREANAYYSPAKKALLFGYFPAPARAVGAGPSRRTVFTCLSHDIIAHETTHALLDGMHRRFNEPSNPDVLAFHEAFADLVALFQHFSLPEVLRHQIAATRGDLDSQNLLGELAQQFGQATGKRGALRERAGQHRPEDRRWKRAKPDPDAYRRLRSRTIGARSWSRPCSTPF